MAAMTIRNIPDPVHRALKARAERNGRSAEAEVRAILHDTLLASAELGLGTWLSSRGAGLWDDDLDIDRSAPENRVEPADFT